MLFIEYSKESYHKFLQMADKEYKVHFTKKQEDMLAYVSQILVNGKRPHELLMLRQLLDNESVERETIREELSDMQVPFRDEDYESAYKVLSMDWLNAPSFTRQQGGAADHRFKRQWGQDFSLYQEE